MKQLKLLSTTPILGYGFPDASLRAGMARGPDIIGCDAGSTDPGPYYLGAGKAFCSRMAIKRDLRAMLHAAVPAGVPMFISTCGGAGGEPHLQDTAAIVREIAREDGLHFRMALIHAEQSKADVTAWTEAGLTAPLSRQRPLDRATVERSARIVGMMGPEPFIEALDQGAQVVLAGRASDPAPWAAACLRAQLPPAAGWYAGKMLECGAEPALPKKEDCLFATVDEDSVTLEPTSPDRACTPLSVANFSLHENASPIFHTEPGGVLDTSDCRFEAVSDRIVRVSGMRWTPSDRYTVKLEGVELAGYRAISMCGTRDPVLIAGLDAYLTRVHAIVEEKATAFGVPAGGYRLAIRVYGRDGVMAAREPVRDAVPHELGLLTEALADTQEVANAVLAIARTTILHSEFPGRLCKEGNMAIPFSPSDFEAGPLYRFSVFHTVAPADPAALFPIEYEAV